MYARFSTYYKYVQFGNYCFWGDYLEKCKEMSIFAKYKDIMK